MRIAFLFGFLGLALGCTSSNGDGGGTAGQGFLPDPPLTIGTDERPADVDIPTDYDPSRSYPLLMVLHGRGTTGRVQTGYLQLFDFVDPKQFILLFPDGTRASMPSSGR